MSECGNPAQSDANELMQKRVKYDRDKTCIKCKERSGKIVIRHTVFCKECFNGFVQLKLRRALDPTINEGPSQPRSKLKASGNLCIGYTGGTGSTLLFHLMHKIFFSDDVSEKRKTKGKQYPSKGRVWEKAYVVYVDISSIYEEYRDQYKQVESILHQCSELELVRIGIENAFNELWWNEIGYGLPSSLRPSQNPIESMNAFLQALPTSSSRSSVITHLIRLILSRFAISTSCSHLLLGTTLTSLSVGLISSITEGGGYHIQEEIEEKFGSLKIIRPLRDVSLKEAAIYLWWNDLKVISHVSTKRTRGMRDLTKNFILGLEKNYPSTVSTILRTSAKVKPKEPSNPDNVCVLCNRPVQSSIQEWKDSIAIRDFRKLSLSDPAPNPTAPVTELPEATAVADTEGPNDSSSLVPHLCYVCHTNLTSQGSRIRQRDVETTVNLPVWSYFILKERQEHFKLKLDSKVGPTPMRREEMKSIVSEFLLAGESEENSLEMD